MKYLDLLSPLKPFTAVLLLFSLFFSGCTFKKKFLPVTHDKHAAYTHVGLSVTKNDISIQNSIDTSVLHRVGEGFSECGGFGEFGMAGIGITILCLPINLPLKMVAGDKASQELELLTKEKGTVQATLKTTDLQQALKKIAVAYAAKNRINTHPIDTANLTLNRSGPVDYAQFSSQGIDSVIEYQIVEISFDDAGVKNLPVYMTLKLKSRLIRTADNRTLDTLEKRVTSSTHPYREWVADEFKLLKEEFNTLLQTVVSHSIDTYLLLYYPTLSDELRKNRHKREAPYYVLSAYYPKPFFATSDMRELLFVKGYARVEGSDRRFVPITEQQPLLRWEPFPWSHDQTQHDRFSEIVYDLEIYEYEGELIYTRKGLKKNEHRVEKALQSDTKYLWSVRARFMLEGKPRFTEWGGLYGEGYRYDYGYNYGWERREIKQAWKFGDKGSEPLEKKRYYYYPFILLEQ